MGQTQPPLAISQGDPAGIGPEIIQAAWRALRETGPRFVTYADPRLFASADVEVIAAPHEASAVFPRALPVINVPLAEPARAGQPTPAHAPAIIASIEKAVKAALAEEVSGVVTAPIAKHVLYDAGFRFPGHTEFLADLTKHAPVIGPRGPVMMLVGGGLRVSLVTIHIPLSEVSQKVTAEAVMQTVGVTDQALRSDLGRPEPKIALCGLNPHAGEGGALGREEIDTLAPAVNAMRARGLRVSGPHSADTMFHAEARASYDAAVALYHDQGLIPIKTLDFHGGVNVTLGLPIVRTSPDHGAAFGIAGAGKARPDSMIAALQLAASMAARRAEYVSGMAEQRS